MRASSDAISLIRWPVGLLALITHRAADLPARAPDGR